MDKEAFDFYKKNHFTNSPMSLLCTNFFTLFVLKETLLNSSMLPIFKKRLFVIALNI